MTIDNNEQKTPEFLDEVPKANNWANSTVIFVLMISL